MSDSPAVVRPARDRWALVAKIQARLSWAYIYANAPTHGLAFSLMSANASLRARASGYRGVPFAMLAATLGTMGLHRRSDLYFAVARQSELRPEDGGHALFSQGLDAVFVPSWIEAMHQFNFARWARARSLIDGALTRAENLGDPHALANSLAVVTIGAYLAGDLDEVERRARRCREVASAGGLPVVELVARTQLALVELHRGEPERGLALLSHTHGDLGAEGIMTEVSRAAVEAAIHYAQGRSEAATVAAERASSLLEANPSGNMTAYLAHSLLPVVYAAAVQRDSTPDRRRRLSQAMKAAARFARFYPVGRPALWRARARVALLRGRPVEAAKAQMKAQARAEQLQMRAELSMAQLVLDRSGRGQFRVGEVSPARYLGESPEAL